MTRPRVLVVAAVVVLVVLGSLLPYLSMPYIDHSGELAHEQARLFAAVQFVGGLDPLWLPHYVRGPSNGPIEVGINVLNLGLDLQQVGLVIAVLTCGSLFQDEINKFFWWPFHLSGWLLTLSPIPLFIGLHLFHRSDVTINLHLGWLPTAVAGVVVLVATFLSHHRIDSYASI